MLPFCATLEQSSPRSDSKAMEIDYRIATFVIELRQLSPIGDSQFLAKSLNDVSQPKGRGTRLLPFSQVKPPEEKVC